MQKAPATASERRLVEDGYASSNGLSYLDRGIAGDKRSLSSSTPTRRPCPPRNVAPLASSRAKRSTSRSHERHPPACGDKLASRRRPSAPADRHLSPNWQCRDGEPIASRIGDGRTDAFDRGSCSVDAEVIASRMAKSAHALAAVDLRGESTTTPTPPQRCFLAVSKLARIACHWRQRAALAVKNAVRKGRLRSGRTIHPSSC